MGAVTLYAKYKYLLCDIDETGITHTVTDAGTGKNPKIEMDVYLNSTYYDLVQNTTLKYLKVEVYLEMWEVDDGYQHIYLTNNGANVWSTKADLGSKHEKRAYTIKVDLEKVKNADTLVFKFDASGAFSDTWKFTDFKAVAYLTNE